MKWKPFNSGTPYTCKDCPAYTELQKVCELVYWNLRAVMENAQDCVPSPNPIWGYMNELYEDVMRLEDALNIPNRMEQ